MIPAFETSKPATIMPQRHETSHKSVANNQTAEFALIAVAVVMAIGVVMLATAQFYLSL